MGYDQFFLVKPRSRDDIEKRTESYLSQYNPEHLKKPGKLHVENLIDLSLSRSHGTKILLVDHLEDKVLARYYPQDNAIIFTEESWNRLCEGHGWERFTGCHEFAHVVLHGDELREKGLYLQRTGVENSKIYRNSEWQADNGAGALLMPRKTIIPLIQELNREGENNRECLSDIIAEVYGVTTLAAKKRLKIIKPDVVPLVQVQHLVLKGAKSK